MEEKQTIDYGVYNKSVERAREDELIKDLDVSRTPLEVIYPDIDLLPNEEFAKIRKQGFGGSDSSVILNVNPFKTIPELIKEKNRLNLTEEELAIGNLVAVRKGRELEPLIIDKHSTYFKNEVFKPKDMYRFKKYPWLTINFDGVSQDAEGNYYPVEIKVVTKKGESHYDFNKAMFNEFTGFGAILSDFTNTNNSIMQKAAYYGIPPYYYTQLQQEMMALNAIGGYLSVLSDNDWRFYSFYIHADHKLWSQLITESYKVAQECSMIKSLTLKLS